MTEIAPTMSAEEFWEWLAHQEDAGCRWELFRGRPVAFPLGSETHGIVCGIAAMLIGNAVWAAGRGFVCANHTALLVNRDPATLRGPDLVVFDRVARWEEVSNGFVTDVPTLVVEVLESPSSHSQTMRRVSEYLRHGAGAVWVIDPEERAVTVHQRGEIPRVLDESEELTGNGVFPDLRLRVSQLFAMPGQG